MCVCAFRCVFVSSGVLRCVFRCGFVCSGVCDWPVCRISQVGFHRWFRGGQLWSASPPSCWQVEADKRKTPIQAPPLSHAEIDTHQTDRQSDIGQTQAGEEGGGDGGEDEPWWPEVQTDRKFIRRSKVPHSYLSWDSNRCLSWWPASYLLIAMVTRWK